MTKSELIQRVAELNPDLRHMSSALSKPSSRRLGLHLPGEIASESEALASSRSSIARLARAGTPRTGTTVEVPRKVIPFFKTGKYLHASVNDES